MEFSPPARTSVAACLLWAIAGVIMCGGLLACALSMETQGFQRMLAAHAGWVRAMAPVAFYLLAFCCGAVLVFLSYLLFRWWPGGPRLWGVQAVMLASSWGLYSAAVLLVLLGNVGTALTHHYAPGDPAVEGVAHHRRSDGSGEWLTEHER